LAAFRERIKEKEEREEVEEKEKEGARGRARGGVGGVAGGNGVLFHPSQPSILCSTIFQRLTKP